ncbi:MAG TPA: AAA family ATPase [Solirubrobacteraceae bacterium]|nr:AAA family ATPase [Solirubrobacteraceae bacterium]
MRGASAESAPVIEVSSAGVGVIGRDRSAPIPDPPLSQRSEGMRTFAALLSFLHAKKADWSNPPVLLVDEAEVHLHYDAQADLVEIFERQELAQCVIYTTHSVGCLPEDLGLGIVVVEESGNERSRVSQSFWTGGPGLTPIMLALGATALSFTPARRVIIGEGAHEAILLPTLLRQARDDVPMHEPLGFQIVGGLSEVSAGTAARLEEEAGTVLYLVDHDAGGRAAAALLPQSVRDSGRVLTLGQHTDAQSIEDFVAAPILVAAADEVLIADGHTALQLQASELPSSGRAKWLEERLSASGSEEARTRLAQAAVVLGASDGLAEPARVPALQALLLAARAAFPS